MNILESVKSLKLGKPIILLDDEDRENEGDFFIPADFLTPEVINFMSIYGRGLICTPITQKLATKLDLPSMVDNNTAEHSTAFTISIDAKENITTGISAFDRFETIKLMNENSSATDFVRPGHIFPLIAKDGGVLERNGHTEAAIELCHLSGSRPVGIICEILSLDGTMAKRDELLELAKNFDLEVLTIKEIVSYLQSIRTENLLAGASL